MSAHESYLQFQLNIFMKEIDLIDNTIGRLDELVLRNRNWGTTLWAGLVVVILQQELANNLLLVTVVIPLLFWLIDVQWKAALLTCSRRQAAISDFLNSPALQDSFEIGQVSSIKLLDPIGRDLTLEKSKWHYLSEALLYKDTSIFYPVQIVGSLLLYLVR
jgi:hypothetical protein